MLILKSRAGYWDSHSQVHPEFGQFLLHFDQCCFAKIANFQQLIFRPLNKIANRVDILGFETIHVRLLLRNQTGMIIQVLRKG